MSKLVGTSVSENLGLVFSHWNGTVTSCDNWFLLFELEKGGQFPASWPCMPMHLATSSSSSLYCNVPSSDHFHDCLRISFENSSTASVFLMHAWSLNCYFKDTVLCQIRIWSVIYSTLFSSLTWLLFVNRKALFAYWSDKKCCSDLAIVTINQQFSQAV